jgi:citrate lyase beta subunit
VKHNQHNANFRFQLEPVEFSKTSNKELLQYCLGGTLYMPATRSIVDKLLAQKLPELTSMVMCFEDAIRAEELGMAEANVLSHLSRLAQAIAQGEIRQVHIPLIFLRVRTLDQFQRFCDQLNAEQAAVLSGFVFPKFYSSNAIAYLEQLAAMGNRLGVQLYGMPILEGPAVAYRESRAEELATLKQLLDPFKGLILNIRVGGTDFSSLFGVRRGINSSIYDILPVRDALSDILNFFNRMEDGYTVSGPVWEYFLAHTNIDLRDLIKQDLHRSLLNREPILNDAIDGLLREVVIDKVNGFVGKTVIHPSHLRYVNAMQAVTMEEYEDARQIIEAGEGVVKSTSGNKMNEANPHKNWARRIINRAKAFGVIASENEYTQLFLDSHPIPGMPALI